MKAVLSEFFVLQENRKSVMGKLSKQNKKEFLLLALV
jgi:hypothetical protein